MKPEVEKLVFTELESESDSTSIAFVAESPIAAYYIDFNKDEKMYRSYSSNAVHRRRQDPDKSHSAV